MPEWQILTCPFNIAKLTDKLVSYFVVGGAHFALHLLTNLVGQSLCQWDQTKELEAGKQKGMHAYCAWRVHRQN